jgi:hypothetical protein
MTGAVLRQDGSAELVDIGWRADDGRSPEAGVLVHPD